MKAFLQPIHRAGRAGLLVACYLTGATMAQEASPATGTPAQAAASARAAMEKWLSDLDEQWIAALNRDVIYPSDDELIATWLRYLGTAETNFAKASRAGDLEGAVAWRTERDHFANGTIPPAGAAVPNAIQQFRTEWQAALTKADKDLTEKTKAMLARYEAALDQAQASLTQRGRLDDAVLVRAKRAEASAQWANGSPLARSAKLAPPTAKPTEAPPPSEPGASGFARIEVKNANVLKLVGGEKIWSDRNVRLTNIPPKFEGLMYTQHRAHGFKLSFKVISDGLLYMGCSARWGTTATAEVAKGFDNEETLKAKGWQRVPNEQVATEAKDMLYLMFSRQCKAGEELSYQTDRYAPPILVWKQAGE